MPWLTVSCVVHTLFPRTLARSLEVKVESNSSVAADSQGWFETFLHRVCVLMLVAWEIGRALTLAASQAWFPPRCECVINGDICAVNHALLGLLQSQLDRCGPSQLTCPAPRRELLRECPSCARWPVGAALGAGLVVGYLVAKLPTERFVCPTRHPAQALEDGVITPSTRRRS